jgi:hypothetical protein
MADPPARWLRVVCGLPWIGDWVATIVGLLPVVLLFAAREFMSIEGDPGNWFMIVGSVVMIPWLFLLERRLDLRINTPVLPIKLLWVIPVLLIGFSIALFD